MNFHSGFGNFYQRINLIYLIGGFDVEVGIDFAFAQECISQGWCKGTKGAKVWMDACVCLLASKHGH